MSIIKGNKMKELKIATENIDKMIADSILKEEALPEYYLFLVGNIEKLKYMAASSSIENRYNYIAEMIWSEFHVSIMYRPDAIKFLNRHGIYHKKQLKNICIGIHILNIIVAMFIFSSIDLIIVALFCCILNLWFGYLFESLLKCKFKTYRLSTEFRNLPPYKGSKYE